MICLDTSAITAIVLSEAESDSFTRLIVAETALLGAPTLLECQMVLASRLADGGDDFLAALTASPGVRVVDFSAAMAEAARRAFLRWGKGRVRGGLNYGDCLSYGVAKVAGVPLLYKGEDLALTDIEPAWRP